MQPTTENIIKAYNVAKETGADSTCKILETLYPDVNFTSQDDRPVTERIKTFEDAVEALGNHALVNQYRRITEEQNPPMDETATDLIAYLKLRIVVAALNEGWEPKFIEDEWRYVPVHFLYTDEELDDKDEEWKRDSCLIPTGDYVTEYAGLAFAGSDDAPSNTYADIGSRLCLKTPELATFCGKQFIELWADFWLLRR